MADRVEPSGQLKAWSRRNDERNATPDIVSGVPLDLSHSVDRNGSLVTVGPADWFVCFVPGLQKQWWHRFVDAKHKHVFAMRPMESGSWVLVESWWTRIMVTVLPSPDAVKFLRWGATGDILRIAEAVPGGGNQLRGWSNCAVLVAFLLGRVSRTWTPHGLYLELVRDGATHEDVQDLLAEQVGRIIAAHAEETLRVDRDLADSPLDNILTFVGKNILRTITTEAVLHLCQTALVEAERYPRISESYHEQGLKPALDVLTRIMERATARGEISVGDCGLAASRFLAMLRGNVHFEAVLGLRKGPSASEIEVRVRSAVHIFLHGVRPARSGTALVDRRSDKPAQMPAD